MNISNMHKNRVEMIGGVVTQHGAGLANKQKKSANNVPVQKVNQVWSKNSQYSEKSYNKIFNLQSPPLLKRQNT